MFKKGLSFNATIGPLLALTVIILMYAGINYNYQTFTIAGYLSILTGIILLINTLATKAYIGTIMAPLMWACMILLVAIGIALVYPPANLIAKSYFTNFEKIAFYAYIAILGLALIHIVTNK